MNWYQMESQEVMDKLNRFKDRGLSQKEVIKRQRHYGKNELQSEKGPGFFRQFAAQFKDFMILTLLAAAGISFFASYAQGEMNLTDPLIILAIVILNALLGIYQEKKAEHSLAHLRSLQTPQCQVLRDGKRQTISSPELVPGDLVYLDTGCLVPADGRLLLTHNLSANESALTGETGSIEKTSGSLHIENLSLGDQLNMVFSGTMITTGNGLFCVTETGMNTQIGKIAGMLSHEQAPQTPLTRRLNHTGKVLGILALIICAILFFLGLQKNQPVFDMFMTSVSLGVAAIPESLPALVTIMLSLGVERMAKQCAVIRHLPAVETLGSASVICSDKTGTITENKMTVKNIYTDMKEFDVTGSGYRINGEIRLGETKPNPKAVPPLYELLKCAVYCSNAEISSDSKLNMRNRGSISGGGSWQVSGNPTEAALLIAAAKGGITKTGLNDMRKISEIPFDSKTKFMSVKMKASSGSVTEYLKGAPDILLKKCAFIMTSDGEKPMTEQLRRKIEDEINSLSSRALRVLALAEKSINSDTASGSGLVFLGLAAMQDPPREEAKEAIRKCAGAKIKTVMITGDHKETAVAIAKQAGLLKGGKAVTGAELDAMSDVELDRRLDEFTVYARVNPSHKLRLVKAYKRKGHIVTMTGDGVNDAPAVKEADVGVAMGITGTDVTKQAADVILLDDNFATLVKAAEQGRGIYANIRKFVRYLLSCNIGEVITMFLSILMGFPMVMLPTQLLLVNLVTDGLPAIALGMEPCGKDVMKKAPRKPDESFFSDGLMFKIIFRGIMIGLCTLGCFTVLLRMNCGIAAARTGALATLIISQLVHVFECKSETKGIFSINYFDNLKLTGAVLISLGVLAAAMYIPVVQTVFSTVSLGKTPLLISLGFSFAVPVISGIGMFFSRKRRR